MLPLFLAGLALAVFVAGVLHEPRSFSNAVFLGLGLALGALGAAERLVDAPERMARLLLLALGLVAAFGPFMVGGYLVLNGITMARRESVRPGNLLSLVTGIGIFALIGLMFATVTVRSRDLSLFTAITGLLCGYVSFLLVSYVIYAFIYSRLTRYHGADFVVVLGSGLRDGVGVTSLLANRLERGREVYQALVARDRSGPMLIVSGGKGGDERLSEAEAMARYLAERGVPADRVIKEGHSRTTEENLIFSRAIMKRSQPDYRCIIVTSNFHVFRAAIIARRVGVNGQVTAARTAGYYWPSAMLREFAAVFLRYKLINFGICALIVVLPLAYVTLRGL
ncbi:MAG TPA: YdcF family protein [Trebonia sp.]